MAQSIPRSIAPTETLVRGIVHPFFYSDSKKSLKPEAFLPPPAKRDVSVLRLAYTSAHFCKQHCSKLRIGDKSLYVGMATLPAVAISQANEIPEVNGVVTVEATPLDNNLQLVTEIEPTTEDSGLPMHADILYRDPAPRGKANPVAMQAARFLLKQSIYHPDPEPESEKWEGDDLQTPSAAA
ncbi:hypothetical protein MON38_10705 [Hymenobacter sp. DH14]|uniref:Uncharacterized protein n=1 Tax=Hymenobacter cyanobacteriorum TaxID=2926463 RepID=A0A9X1VFC0_9BACT|nr:hypothetical protein [Hymenobacter cyanobacteriorum]MCI1187891.1 hypothetical protein [Hymenobacter cyanobacteriorum]